MKIREAVPNDAPGIAKVHVDTWRTTYPGMIPDEVLARFTYARSEECWRADLEAGKAEQFTLVAETDDGQIAGLVSAGPIRDEITDYDGEIYAIYVLQEHQGKGCGQQLMSAAAQRLKAEGYSSMMLWVLADNHPSRRFYERCGGVPIAEREIEIHGVSLAEVGYGWKSLALIGGPDGPK